MAPEDIKRFPVRVWDCRKACDNPVPPRLGLALLVAGAKGFIHGVEDAPACSHLSPAAVAADIPIATELPEKVNSILWIASARTPGFGTLPAQWYFRGTTAQPSASCSPVGAAPGGARGYRHTLLARCGYAIHDQSRTAQGLALGINGAMFTTDYCTELSKTHPLPG